MFELQGCGDGVANGISSLPIGNGLDALPSGELMYDLELNRSTAARLRRFGRKLLHGCALTTVAIGGSSTAGHALPRHSRHLYHSKLARWLNSTTPRGSVSHTNAGLPATGPEYMEKVSASLACLQASLPEYMEKVSARRSRAWHSRAWHSRSCTSRSWHSRA